MPGPTLHKGVTLNTPPMRSRLAVDEPRQPAYAGPADICRSDAAAARSSRLSRRWIRPIAIRYGPDGQRRSGGGKPIVGPGHDRAVLNRFNVSGYGDSITDMAKAPAPGRDGQLGYHEFSMWNPASKQGCVGRQINPTSETYAEIADVVDRSTTAGFRIRPAAQRTIAAGKPPKQWPQDWFNAQPKVKVGSQVFVGSMSEPGRRDRRSSEPRWQLTTIARFWPRRRRIPIGLAIRRTWIRISPRLAASIRQARSKASQAGVGGGYRGDDVTGSAFGRVGYSAHGYGLASDVSGIGVRGSDTWKTDV